MKINVKKYDPTLDEAPHYVEYEVPKVEYMTLLQALVYINENCEELAYDYSCRGRICGRCAMMLDGVPCMACVTPLNDAPHTVEPLAGFPVIRDLVVDKSEFYDRITSLTQRVRSTDITWEEVAKPVDPHAAVTLNGIERCARCGSCVASCPVVGTSKDGYVGPAGMIAVALRYYDPYDEADRVLKAVDEGLWNCILCGKCDEVCPVSEMDHQAIWNELREAATERGLTAKTSSILAFGKK